MKALFLYFLLYGISNVFTLCITKTSYSQIEQNIFILQKPKNNFNSKQLIMTSSLMKKSVNLYHEFPSAIYNDDLRIFKKLYMVRKPFYNKISKPIYGIINYTKRITNKTNHYLRLIRSENILPTLLLSFTGGWIMNPSIYNLFHSTRFISASIITILVMSSSMVINDLFDIEIDKTNNPYRPLVTGAISKKEAIVFLSIMLGFAEFLNSRYLPIYLQSITHIAIMVITFYTPFFKRKLFLKNLSCAALVSFASSFAGFSANPIRQSNTNAALLWIASRMVFFGSLSNEILLDVIDYNGDKRNNVLTIPVVFGKQTALSIVYSITYFNILVNTVNLINLYNFNVGILLMFFSSPLIYYLNRIKENIYDDNTILYYVKQTVKPMLLSLLYFCFITPR
jgi:geranylgeranylglycerol-phosphate geranylgeranyltransferase